MEAHARLLTLDTMHLQAAYDANGAPTKALTGFAAKNGVAAEGVRREADAKGVEYMWATRKQAGRAAAEVHSLAPPLRTTLQLCTCRERIMHTPLSNVEQPACMAAPLLSVCHCMLHAA